VPFFALPAGIVRAARRDSPRYTAVFLALHGGVSRATRRCFPRYTAV